MTREKSHPVLSSKRIGIKGMKELWEQYYHQSTFKFLFDSTKVMTRKITVRKM